MNDVGYNRACACPRCKCRGFMGPAVLVTLGVLFLLSEFHVVGFGSTWPLLLIVIGLVKVMQSNAPTTGHTVDMAPPGATPAPDSQNPQVPHV